MVLGGCVGFLLRHGLEGAEAGREVATGGAAGLLLGLLKFGLFRSVNLGALDTPCDWPYVAGHNLRRRVFLLTLECTSTLWSNEGPNILRSAGPYDSWRPHGLTNGNGGTALDHLFCVGPPFGYPRGHTPYSGFEKYSWLPWSWEGPRELARVANHLCGRVCAPSAQGTLAAEIGFSLQQ
ncbi:hypothetical protein EVAR_72207_1 [Eumeta japonica]|uniref:Uncharacterized protein n=1 Tax=Eumeta variegata TaxID=151549 RepID=A0A4C1SJZ5_EUMVA|nr:hypothetical protein EVAR_72207_1 [Eumeta japonica]